MDGDARRPQGPQEMGYSARLEYPEPPVVRADARPVQPPRPEKKQDEHEPDQDKSGKVAAGGDEKDGEKPKKPLPRWRKLLYWGIGLTIAAALIVAGVLYYLHNRHFESTDDAFIDGYITQLSSQVAGRVIALDVQDNQDVKTGDIIVRIDPRDYQIKLDQAKAQRAQSQAQLAQAQAQGLTQQANLDQAQANVRVSQADFQQAQGDYNRYRAIDPKAITRQTLENSGSSTRAAQARVDANRQAVEAAQANIEVQKAAIQAAQASLAAADVGIANAELQLSYATVQAPRDGKIAKRTVNIGDYVNPGQALLAVVGNERWVTANFKETQLAAMKPGQHVSISVDACPSHPFEGTIDSFQPGSGSIFSTLPAENATGNYVKVVQRVPVKITFNDANFDGCRLSPGMSVGPQVRVR